MCVYVCTLCIAQLTSLSAGREKGGLVPKVKKHNKLLMYPVPCYSSSDCVCVPECPVVVVVVVVAAVVFVSQFPCTSTSMGPLDCHWREHWSLEEVQKWSEAG